MLSAGLSQAGGRGARAPPPLPFLEDLLTLSQPGGQIMPTTLLTPQIFRPSYGPAQDHHDDSGNV